jgi:hypothetical protein
MVIQLMAGVAEQCLVEVILEWDFGCLMETLAVYKSYKQPHSQTTDPLKVARTDGVRTSCGGNTAILT